MSSPELKPILIQVTVFHINEVDMSNENFQAKFDLSVFWNRSYGKKGSFEPEIRFPNAINYKEMFRYRLPPTITTDNNTMDGYRATYEGKFRTQMDLRKFPFDEQFFKISLLLGRDKGTGRDLTIQDGFILSHHESYDSFVINPNTEHQFGEIEKRTADYSLALNQMEPSSKYITLIPAKRKYEYYLYNHYTFVFLIFVMSFGVFLLDSPYPAVNISQSANRMGLTLNLFLSLVAYKFALSTSLPPVRYLTAFDKYNLLCFVCLVLQFLWQGICFNSYFNGDSRSLNLGAIVLAIGVLLGHIIILYDNQATGDDSGYLSCPRVSLMRLFTFRERRPSSYQNITDFEEAEETKDANAIESPHVDRSSFATVDLSPSKYRGFDNYGQI